MTERVDFDTIESDATDLDMGTFVYDGHLYKLEDLADQVVSEGTEEVYLSDVDELDRRFGIVMAALLRLEKQVETVKGHVLGRYTAERAEL